MPKTDGVEILQQLLVEVTRQLTAADLSTALDNSSLASHCQPVVRWPGPRTWRVASVEALGSTGSRLACTKCVSVAGRIGLKRLLQRLTDFVLLRGIELPHSWKREGLHLGLRVNVVAGLIALS